MSEINDASKEVAEETGGDRGEIDSHLREMRALGVPMEEAKKSAIMKYSDKKGENDAP